MLLGWCGGHMSKAPLMNNPLKDPIRARNACRVIEKIFDHWKINDHEKTLMLGVNDDAYCVITESKKIPATEEMLLRASDIIAIFRILSTMYDFDHETIGRCWIKRKNWRAPFYGDRPIDHIARGYLALLETRRHLEALIKSYGGAQVGKDSVIIGEIMIGEIVAFNNFLLLQNEDADILAMMLLRVCGVWKLTHAEVQCVTHCELSEIKKIADARHFPEENILVRWRMTLMIHHGLLVLHQGNEDVIYCWMCTSHIKLKNGMTPLQVLVKGELKVLYELLKSLVEFMP
jgi:hypothetical protein